MSKNNFNKPEKSPYPFDKDFSFIKNQNKESCSSEVVGRNYRGAYPPMKMVYIPAPTKEEVGDLVDEINNYLMNETRNRHFTQNNQNQH